MGHYTRPPLLWGYVRRLAVSQAPLLSAQPSVLHQPKTNRRLRASSSILWTGHYDFNYMSIQAHCGPAGKAFHFDQFSGQGWHVLPNIVRFWTRVPRPYYLNEDESNRSFGTSSISFIRNEDWNQTDVGWSGNGGQQARKISSGAIEKRSEE
jgi:hypothetical protein